MIDDNGIEFYLSDSDQKRRKRKEQNEDGSPENPEPEVDSPEVKTFKDVLSMDPIYQHVSSKLETFEVG